MLIEVLLGDLVEKGNAALWAVEDELEVHDLLPETHVFLLEVVDLVRESVGHGLLESFEVLLGEAFDGFLHGVKEVVNAFRHVLTGALVGLDEEPHTEAITLVGFASGNTVEVTSRFHLLHEGNSHEGV